MQKPKNTSEHVTSANGMTLTENQREVGNQYFKKVLSDHNRKLDDLQHIQSNLQKNIPKMAKKPGISKAALAYSILGDLIDECMHDVLFDTHRDLKQENLICQICQSKCRHYVKRQGYDVWGKSYTVNNLPSYECVNCQKTIASTRYAPHLEKCLGLAGRQSSRVASRRMGGQSPFSSDDMSSPSNNSNNNNGSGDEGGGERKKKKHGSPSFSNGVSRVKKLKYMGNDS
ncbi:hypothetical protein K501DRAFT_215655 [Backusella circina FSU 941]|nr:hypothetical protein K501DRAFT_215655 [Backusella circina FSU 941]